MGTLSHDHVVPVIQVTKLAEQLALLHRQQQDREDQHRQQQQHQRHGRRNAGWPGEGRGRAGTKEADSDTTDPHPPSSQHHSELSELRRQLQVWSCLTVDAWT